MARRRLWPFYAAGIIPVIPLLGWAARKMRPPRKALAPMPPDSESIMQTGYFHLESISVSPGQRVRRGQKIGVMGADPNGGPRHLHFEVAPYPFPGKKYSRDVTLDPRPLLDSGNLAMPLASYQGRAPVISSGHRDENPSRPTHAGVDIMFARLDSDTQPSKKGEGAPRFVAPKGISVLAAHDGIVTRAGKINTGYRVWIRRI